MRQVRDEHTRQTSRLERKPHGEKGKSIQPRHTLEDIVKMAIDVVDYLRTGDRMDN